MGLPGQWIVLRVCIKMCIKLILQIENSTGYKPFVLPATSFAGSIKGKNYVNGRTHKRGALNKTYVLHAVYETGSYVCVLT